MSGKVRKKLCNFHFSNVPCPMRFGRQVLLSRVESAVRKKSEHTSLMGPYSLFFFFFKKKENQNKASLESP